MHKIKTEEYAEDISSIKKKPLIKYRDKKRDALKGTWKSARSHLFQLNVQKCQPFI